MSLKVVFKKSSIPTPRHWAARNTNECYNVIHRLCVLQRCSSCVYHGNLHDVGQIILQANMIGYHCLDPQTALSLLARKEPILCAALNCYLIVSLSSLSSLSGITMSECVYLDLN